MRLCCALRQGCNWTHAQDEEARDDGADGIKYGSGERFAGPLVVTPGLSRTQAPDMVMRVAGAIEGVVTDTAGTPIVGVEIEIAGFDVEGSELVVGELPFTGALGQYQRRHHDAVHHPRSRHYTGCRGQWSTGQGDLDSFHT